VKPGVIQYIYTVRIGRAYKFSTENSSAVRPRNKSRRTQHTDEINSVLHAPQLVVLGPLLVRDVVQVLPGLGLGLRFGLDVWFRTLCRSCVPGATQCKHLGHRVITHIDTYIELRNHEVGRHSSQRHTIYRYKTKKDDQHHTEIRTRYHEGDALQQFRQAVEGQGEGEGKEDGAQRRDADHGAGGDRHLG
jgi:hypothetical protein